MERDALNFAGKTVIVTGGNGGIGQGIVEVFGARDANVVIADVGEALTPPTNSGSGRLIDIRTDISDRASVDSMVAKAMAEFGRIDVLINNAGRGEGMAKLPDVTQHMVDWMVKLNITGTVNMTQAVVAEMLKGGGGSIVNVTSAAALYGAAGCNDPIYAGVKGFLHSFTKALAFDLGPSNIRVNSVAPGWIVPERSEATSTASFWNTMPIMGKPHEANEAYERALKDGSAAGAPTNRGDLPPLRKLGRPSDIAYACLYFASEAAQYATGQVLSIGGGGYMPS
jgi:NAD(P)-dependent dehydrogenase (short-subunit alcohol dehydrogenase family)